jgi:hypothetical protein
MDGRTDRNRPRSGRLPSLSVGQALSVSVDWLLLLVARCSPLLNEPVPHSTVAVLQHGRLVFRQMFPSINCTVFYYVDTVRINVIPVLKDDFPLFDDVSRPKRPFP